VRSRRSDAGFACSSRSRRVSDTDGGRTPHRSRARRPGL